MSLGIDWRGRAMTTLNAQAQRSDPPLINAIVPEARHVSLYLKDESRNPAGNAMFRVARALFHYALASNWLRLGQPVVDACSPQLAIAEALIAQAIEARYVVVIPADTSRAAIDQLRSTGADVRLAPGAETHETARALAEGTGGLFLDAANMATRALEWRGGGLGLADPIFAQLKHQLAASAKPDPIWIVLGAGVGAAAAVIGRFVRTMPELAERSHICVVDPVGSAYMPAFRYNDRDATGAPASIADGIGAWRVGASFEPSLIDRMITTPDAAIVSACLWGERFLGSRVGPATGANLVGVLAIAAELRRHARTGTIISVIADSGALYEESIFNAQWRRSLGADFGSWVQVFDRFDRSGDFVCALDDAAPPIIHSSADVIRLR